MAIAVSLGILVLLILNQALAVHSLCNAPDEIGVSNAELVDVIDADDRFVDGDVLNYRCNAGFRPERASNRVCKDGQWTSIVCILETRLSPKAHMKLYKLGKSRFNGREYTSRIYSAREFKRGTKLLAKCKNGYEMYDEDTKDYSDKTSLIIEVNYGGTHPPLQTCIKARCIVPEYNGTTYSDDGKLVAADKKMIDGTKLTKLCAIGYEITDERDIMCDRGSWNGDISCNLKSCQLPSIENSMNNEDERIIYHNEQWSLTCINIFKLVRDGKEFPSGNIETTCTLGNLTRSFDGFECVPRGCHSVPNAVLHNNVINSREDEEMPLTFDHSQYAWIKCNEHFSLVRNGIELPGDTSLKPTKCSYGNWYPNYCCKKSNANALGTTSVSPDADMSDNENIWKTVTDSPESDPDNYVDYGSYEYADEDEEADAEVECQSPKHGKLSNVFDTSYTVACNDGYTLNSNGIDFYYKCSGGKLKSRIFGIEPICTEPLCQKTCYENGGTCVAPNTCKCDHPRYGINCEKGAAYSVILIVGRNQWDGTNYNVTVSLGNQNGDKITVLFKGPMYRGTTHTSTIRAEYIGQIEKSSIEVKVITHIDNIVIDTLHVTVDNANDIEEYIFRNVGTVDRQRYVLPETGCSPPTLTIKSAKQKKRYIAGDELRDRDVICPEGLSLSPASITCLNTGQWLDSVSCAKDAVYTITIFVRVYRWDGTINNVNVILSNQNRDEIKVLFEGPLFPGSNTTNTISTKYIGQIEKSSIAVTGDDNIYINKMNVIVENDNKFEEYLFNNVGSVIRQIDTLPEAGCPPPPLTIKSQKKKQRYIAGYQLHDSDVLCPEGHTLFPASITCLKTAQWSDSVSCAKVTRYRVTLQIGNHYYAGTPDDLYVTFTGSLGQTASKKLVTERKDRNRQYIYDVYANNAGQIQEITIELSGDDDVQLKYVRLDVIIDNTEESYMFSVGGWTKNRKSLRNGISISPDPGCLAPTGQFQLRTQKVKFITDEEIKINEVQCQNGEPQTALKCVKDGRWSGTPCGIKAAGTRTYHIEIKTNRGTKCKVEVALHGKDGISDTNTFLNHGLKKGQKIGRSFRLSNIGEVTKIQLTLSGDFNDPMEIDYIQLTIKETNEKYFFFHNGPIYGYTHVNAKQFFRPGCAGESFTDGHRGYNTLQVQGVQADLNLCKEICRTDIECMAIEISIPNRCYIIKTNDLHTFVFKDDYSRRKFFFRIC